MRPRRAARRRLSAYGVEIIVFRASSPGADEDWDAPHSGRGFGSSANRGGATPQVLSVLQRHATIVWTRVESDAEAAAAHGGRSPMRPGFRPRPTGARIRAFALSDLGINVPGLSRHWSIWSARRSICTWDLTYSFSAGRDLHHQGNAQRQVQRQAVLRSSGLRDHRRGDADQTQRRGGEPSSVVARQ